MNHLENIFLKDTSVSLLSLIQLQPDLRTLMLCSIYSSLSHLNLWV